MMVSCLGRFVILQDNPRQGDEERDLFDSLYLLIAKLPSSYLQFKQFLGRTGRIGNKAQYSIILFDQDAQNDDGLSYLEKKLEVLQNNDLQRLSSDLYTG